MFKLRKTLIFILIIYISTLVSCSKINSKSASPISRTEVFMGTVVRISLYDSDNSKILDKAFKKVQEIEQLVSANEAGTEIDAINKSAGKNPVKVSTTTFDIIEKGLEYSNLSNGDFDITVGPLVKLWNMGHEDAKVPTEEEINTTLPLIGFNGLELNKQESTIFLKNENMALDLGAIAKGYTADEVAKVLIENEVNSAIIDLGGNVYAHGTKPSGDNWTVGIQNPFSTRGDIIGTIKVSNKTVVTSGIYERYIEKDNVKYHHLLNPHTGYPFDNDIAGVSIITDKSIDADALSTTVFAKGVENGLAFVESLENVDAIFVNKNKEVYITDGLQDNFSIMNKEFILLN